ncbi:type II toxin-antitoxin system HicB family antitoxin [Paenibacillus sanguinis]|uniref:type II toxin-antitoxin system HicB family antitoxin n=1 Tax=Paenibacillus sanguinis TaxID=225906 RepID=UPI00035E9C65|nr:type II toxin-antitoxin system HicB family antitoxin [Paenibacillus sanguinis]
MKLRYYAIFNFAEDGINVTFPDLPGCITCGYTTEEAIKMAKEALELYLDDVTEDDIPNATEVDPSTLELSEKLFLIEVIL